METVESYISDEEYSSYFETLAGVRPRIARVLPIVPDMRILEIGSGYAYFAIEIARISTSIHVTGIDISEDSVQKARTNVARKRLHSQIDIIKMDATHMDFSDEQFDMAVNFCGLEDIHMTRGRNGVGKTFSEVYRVLKPQSHFCFVVMPVDAMETDAQKLEVALYSYICDATWLTRSEYTELAYQTGFTSVAENEYTTGKKLSAQQAQKEIRFACDNVPRIYGVAARSYADVWAQFRQKIERHGLGHLSKVVLMITQKS